MRSLRNLSFVTLMAALLFLKYSVSLRADMSCNPPAYGYGYVVVWDDGTCEDNFDDEMDCWGPCTDCFETEDQGSIDFCEDNNDETGQWFDAVCDCHVI